MAKPTQQELIDQAVADAVAAALQNQVSKDSKPHLVESLRSTWRGSSQHAAEQIKRFVRLLVISSVPVLTSAFFSGSHFDKKTLLALLVPVLETTYRQVFPALGAAAADDAPGVTIVPEQVEETEGDAAP